MSKGLEKLKEIKDDVVAEYIDDYKEHFDIIEKELKRLEELEIMYSNCVIEGAKLKKAFDTLSKEDEKTKKLLSKEIEKNRALEIIKDEFEISFNDKKQTIQFESVEEPYTHIRFSLTREIKDKEKYDLLKGVLL